MKTWDEMEPRERDAWIAVNVMGWTLADRRQMGWGDGPDVWLTGEDRDDPNSNPTHQDPKFTTDASADYLVLVRVRETWGPNAFVEYSVRLQRLLTLRLTSKHPLCGAMMFYEPGDYSKAAYLALTEART